jgi:hypothetical protein
MNSAADKQPLPLTTTTSAGKAASRATALRTQTSWIHIRVHMLTFATCLHRILEIFAKLQRIYIQNKKNHIRKTRLKARSYFVAWEVYNTTCITYPQYSSPQTAEKQTRQVLVHCCNQEWKELHILQCCALELECQDPTHLHSITTTAVIITDIMSYWYP